MKAFKRLITKQSQQVINSRQILRKRQDDQLNLLNKLKSNVDKSLLDLSIEELLSLNSQKVFNTFATRCLKESFRSLNSLADVNIQRAISRNPTGVPFTVKDHLKVDEMIQTCGFSDNTTSSKESADVVKLLERQGCIAYAHTNVPQGLLGIQSANHVYGLAKNPYNSDFISGGSSGGEAIQVAVRASAFGVCSDSGGSVRIPASFCGVYGFKPSGTKRLSVRGRVGATGRQGPSFPDLDPSFGFITRSIEDLAWLCSKTLGKNITPSIPMLYGGEWNATRYAECSSKKLRIGYILQDEEMQTAPAIKNSLIEVLNILREEGHEIVQFEFPWLHKFRDFFFEYVNNTGFVNAIAYRLGTERTTSQNNLLVNHVLYGKIGLKWREYSAKTEQEKNIYRIFLKQGTTQNLLKAIVQKNAIKNEYLKKWNSLKLDVLLSPTMPFTAPLHNQSQFLVNQLTFCCFQNVMELPAGNLPVRKVRPEETVFRPRTFFDHEVAKSIHMSEGLPACIQVTGEHLKQEECIAAMLQINRLIQSQIKDSLKSSQI